MALTKGRGMKIKKMGTDLPKIAKKTVKKPRKLASGGDVRTVKKRDGDNPVKIY
jgi:hypothetical protein